MQFSDHDLSFTAASQDHVDHLQNAVTLYLSSDATLPDALNTLLEQDPCMPMAWCFQGYLLKLAAHPGLQANLDEVCARATACNPAANHREQQHIAALLAWAQGDVDSALRHLEHITDDHPLDMIALRIAHYLHFYNGRGQDMARSTTKVIAGWPTDHPHYSFLLGMHAFGLEESGDYHGADQYAAQALARNRRDLWSIHAMDHVFYMRHQHQQGIEWLLAHQNELAGTNNFRNHLHWHHALHLLAQGEFDATLALYDNVLNESTADDFYLDLCNNASLLWRCEASGIDVGDRWQPLAEVAIQHLNDRELVFASMHYLLPILRAEPDALVNFRRNLTGWAQQPNHQGQLVATVGLAITDTLLGHAQQSLASESVDLSRLGGSKVQREIFNPSI